MAVRGCAVRRAFIVSKDGAQRSMSTGSRSSCSASSLPGGVMGS
jgi:hypothetical protein